VQFSRLLEQQRHQARPERGHLQTELLRYAVAEIRRADFRNRQTSRCDDQGCGFEHAKIRRNDEAFFDFPNAATRQDLYIRCRALLLQHAENVLGRPVAEQLSQFLFMPGDAVPLYKTEKVLRLVAGQRGFMERRIGGDEVLRLGVHVGEVAAAASGDANFLSHRSVAFENDSGPSALACFDGAHQPGGSGADNNHVGIRHSFRHHIRTHFARAPAHERSECEPVGRNDQVTQALRAQP
jgi:hypothetical protein